MKPFIIVLGLLAAACSASGRPPGSQPPSSQPTSSQPSLSGKVILPSRTMTAGSSLRGQVIVQNNTGHAIRVYGCGSLFQVVLVGHRYHPQVAWPTCLQPFTIPAGRSSYRVTVVATYIQCSQNRSSDNVVACLPGGGPPPLPPGNYRAVLFQSSHLLPTPPAIPMRLTPRVERR